MVRSSKVRSSKVKDFYIDKRFDQCERHVRGWPAARKITYQLVFWNSFALNGQEDAVYFTIV